MAKSEKEDNVLDLIAEVIFDQYEPADTFGEADTTPSTIELFEKIQQFYPADYTADEFVCLLVDRGYKFDQIDFNFIWLLKERS